MDNFQKENDEAMMRMHQNMESVTMTEDNGIDFARMMIAHHQGAIDMADILLKYSKHDDMKTLASKVREGNANSINRLNNFISTHGAAQKDSTHMMFMQEDNLAMAKMKETMMAAHYTPDPDYDFAQMMIHHHQGAIDMAKIALKYVHDAGAKTEAQMTLEQENEIRELAQWLNSHGEPQKHKKK